MDHNYSGKRVLILGLGLNEGGVGSARFFAKNDAHVRVTDLKTDRDLKPSLEQLSEFPNIEYTLGEHKFEDIDWADIVIRNPAIRPNNEYLKYAREKGKKVELDMGIFLEFIDPKRVIGITGTKGKSTTASLVNQILLNFGKRIIFAGNIGKSVLDTLDSIEKDSLILLEISSFQLEAWDEHKLSPHWAVITNIFPDHLNYYDSMDQYVASKKIIGKYQSETDFLFLRKQDPVTQAANFLDGLSGTRDIFSTEDIPADFEPKMKGLHNLENIACAVAVCKTLGIHEEDSLRVAKDFEGIDFRMQLIKKMGHFRIYNDSAATNPEAAIAALKAFPSCILITGGMNKNLDFKEYADQIDKLAKQVYFIEGTATDQIKEYMKDKKKIMSTYTDLTALLRDLKINVTEHDIVLFSPGATSFNFFHNEFDRGRKFNEAVERVFG